MENVVKSLAQAQLTGFKKEKDFWVQRQFADGRLDYSYKVLYSIDKDSVKKLLNDAASGQKADTPEKVSAKDKVKKLIDADLPALTTK